MSSNVKAEMIWIAIFLLACVGMVSSGLSLSRPMLQIATVCLFVVIGMFYVGRIRLSANDLLYLSAFVGIFALNILASHRYGFLELRYAVNISALALGLFAYYVSSAVIGLSFEKVFGRVAVLSAPLVLLLPFYAEFDDNDRLGGVISPTVVAMSALSLAYLSSFYRNLLLKWAAYIAVFPIIMATSSRSVLITYGIVVAGNVAAMFIRSGRSFAVKASIFGLLCVAAIYLVFPVVAEVMLLDDPHRGIESGFSGRVAIWSWVFQNADLLTGVGYRNEELFLPAFATSTHNGWLSVLLEWGIGGFIIFGFLVVKYLHWELSSGHDLRRLSIAISYCAFMIVERYSINFGNVMSLVFVAILFAPIRAIPGHCQLSASTHRPSFGVKPLP